MVTIETALGSSQELDEKSIVYLLVEKAARKVPVLTANFAENVEGGYVVAEAPENLAELVLNTAARKEYEKAWLFVEGIKERNEKEKERLEAYELRRLQQEEDAKKAPLELILEGLARSGVPVRVMLQTYREKGLLYPNQQKNLLGLLKLRGFDKGVLVDFQEALEGRGFIDAERTWDILVGQYNVRLPEKEPAPKAELRDVPPLMEELEAVVRSACKRQPLEMVAISSNAWVEARIDASAVYRKAAESAMRLDDSYFLVKATGIGEAAGSIRIVELDESRNSLKSGTPRQLRGNLRLPTEIVDDFCRLFVALERAYAREVDGNPDLSKLPHDEKVGVYAIILERLLKGKTDIACSFYLDLNTKQLDEYKKKYGEVAEAMAGRIENGEEVYSNFKLGDNAVISASDVQDVMNYLVGLVPEDLYLLRWMWPAMRVTERYRRDGKRAEREGVVQEGFLAQKGKIESLSQESREIYGRISASLRHLAEGAGRWPAKTPRELDLGVFEFYGLNHVAAAAKS